MSDTALALLGSVLSALAASVILLALALARTRERLVRLEAIVEVMRRENGSRAPAP